MVGFVITPIQWLCLGNSDVGDGDALRQCLGWLCRLSLLVICWANRLCHFGFLAVGGGDRSLCCCNCLRRGRGCRFLGWCFRRSFRCLRYWLLLARLLI